MLFSTIINGRYKAFSRMKEEEKIRNIGVVKYIEVLASMAGIDIMGWDCKAIFGTGTGNKLVHDKNEINRLFFSEVERVAAAAPASNKAIAGFTDAIKAQVKTAHSRHLAANVAMEQERADDLLRSANEYYRRYQLALLDAGKHFAAMQTLSGQEIDIEDQVKQVVAGSFWDFLGLEGDSLIFKTRSDVAISYKNPAAGIDMTVNFGKFKALFDVARFELKVKPHERNINSRGYYHPHIASSGGICWGSAQLMATAAIARCQLLEPMNMLTTILCSYNSSSPYEPLEKFHEMVGGPEEMVARQALDTQLEQSREAWDEYLDDAPQIDWNLAHPATVVEASPVAEPQPIPEVVSDAAEIGPIAMVRETTYTVIRNA